MRSMKWAMCACLVLFSCNMVQGRDLRWDVNAIDPNNQVGDGVWDTLTANWWEPVSESNVTWLSGDDAFLARGDGTPYSVMVDEEIHFGTITFAEDANCFVTGTGDLVLYDRILAERTSGVFMYCDIYRHQDEEVGDVEILVLGRDEVLALYGDIYMSEYYSGTEDLVFGRDGYGTGYVYIDMQGDLFNNTINGTVNIRGWHPNQLQLAGAQVVLNGTMRPGKELRLHTGGRMEVGGRLEADYINMFSKTSVTDYLSLQPILEGADNDQGVWAITTAGYNGSRYVKSTRVNAANKGGGKIYAVNLNLEIDVTGLDFNDPTKNTYRLVDQQGASGGRWFGSLRSYYAAEPAGVAGTVITMVNMPPTGDSTTSDIYFTVETADFDQNGCVNYEDFSIWAGQWRSSCDEVNDWCSGRDLDHNGMVDPNDLMLMGDKWLAGCP